MKQLLVAMLAIVFSATSYAEGDDKRAPPIEDPATTIADVMAGIAFAARCHAITPTQGAEAGRRIMMYGLHHDIAPEKSGEIGAAAIAATARMPEYVFTDSLCNLYAIGVRNLLVPIDK
jgi:hypothetical protein